MNILLRDKDKGYEGVAIIRTKTSTVKDINDAIRRTKEIDDYNSDDLANELPKDCIIEWFDSDTDDEVCW